MTDRQAGDMLAWAASEVVNDARRAAECAACPEEAALSPAMERLVAAVDAWRARQ